MASQVEHAIDMFLFSVQIRLRSALRQQEAQSFAGSLHELLGSRSLTFAGGGDEQWRIIIGPGSPDSAVTEEHRRAVTTWLKARPEVIASHAGIIRTASTSESELFEDIWLQAEEGDK